MNIDCVFVLLFPNIRRLQRKPFFFICLILKLPNLSNRPCNSLLRKIIKVGYVSNLKKVMIEIYDYLQPAHNSQWQKHLYIVSFFKLMFLKIKINI